MQPNCFRTQTCARSKLSDHGVGSKVSCRPSRLFVNFAEWCQYSGVQAVLVKTTTYYSGAASRRGSALLHTVLFHADLAALGCQWLQARAVISWWRLPAQISESQLALWYSHNILFYTCSFATFSHFFFISFIFTIICLLRVGTPQRWQMIIFRVFFDDDSCKIPWNLEWKTDLKVNG